MKPKTLISILLVVQLICIIIGLQSRLGIVRGMAVGSIIMDIVFLIDLIRNSNFSWK